MKQRLGRAAFVVGLLGIAIFGGWGVHLLFGMADRAAVVALTPVPGNTTGRIIIVEPPQGLAKTKCAFCGVIISTRLVVVDAENAVRGAVVGSHLGNLLGGVRGQELFGLLGVVAAMHNGSAARADIRYETMIRFDNGATRIFTEFSRPQWRPGDRIRVIDDAIKAFIDESIELKQDVLPRSIGEG